MRLLVASAVTLSLLLLVVVVSIAYGMSNGAPDIQCMKCHIAAGKADFVVQGLPEKYEPGKTYKIVIKITKGPDCSSGAACGGFAFWASAGEIMIVDKEHTFKTQIAGKTIATHTKKGSLLREWTIEWKAPSKPQPVKVVISVIAANGDSSPTGDGFAVREFTLEPAGGAAKPTPKVVTTTIVEKVPTTTVITTTVVKTSRDPVTALAVAIIIFLIVVGGYLVVARR